MGSVFLWRVRLFYQMGFHEYERCKSFFNSLFKIKTLNHVHLDRQNADFLEKLYSLIQEMKLSEHFHRSDIYNLCSFEAAVTRYI